MAYQTTPSPIDRGVFVNKHITCTALQPPPDDFTIPDQVPGNTNRERTANATEPCGPTCHGVLINPPGFAYENFDAIGKVRDNDGGFPINTSGEWLLGANTVSFSNSNQLIEHIAGDIETHKCYVRHWFEYTNGRLVSSGDLPLIARLGEVSLAGDATIKELIAAIVLSDPFMKRANE